MGCKLPETRIFVIKKGESYDIKTKCKACGKTARIDEKEKLSSHIKKNPPKYNDDDDINKKKDKDVGQAVDKTLTKEIMKRMSKKIKNKN